MTVISTLFPQDRVIEIVDIGASNLRDGPVPPYNGLIDAELARVTGFEPNPDEFSRLVQGPHRRYLPVAVGDGKPAQLHVTEGPGFSSLLPPDAEVAARIGVFSRLMAVRKTVPVETHRLDDIAEIETIDLLKIDIQGSEAAVFLNGRAKLENALMIITEVSFLPIYHGQPNFADQDRILQSMGFQFFGMKSTAKAPFAGLPDALRPKVRKKDVGPWIDGDAIYLRRFEAWDDLASSEIRRLIVLLDGVCSGLSAIHYLASILRARGELSVAAMDKVLHEIRRQSDAPAELARIPARAVATPARWSIVSTMHGFPETILPCVAHHLNSDADRIHIYLDGPVPEVQAVLASEPRCVVTVCDDAYWAKRPGGRHDNIVFRQLFNLSQVRQHSDSDWLVHIDSDEFLVNMDPAAPLTLAAELARVPEQHDWMRIMPMERVLPESHAQQTIFDGMFRGMTTDSALIEAAFGPGAAFLWRGMSGHSHGKIAFRRKTRHRVRLHDLVFPPPPGMTVPQGIKLKGLPPFTQSRETQLLHFEGWTPLQWVSKLLRFAEQGIFLGHNWGRVASVRYMADNPDPADRLGLFDRVQRLGPEGLALMEGAGLIRSAPFDPSALARATFPDVAMDFSVSAFDARLRTSNPDFYRRNGL